MPSADRPRLYLAAPLFSSAELSFNRKVRDAISPYFRVFLPQEGGGLLADAIASGEDQLQASDRIFATDLHALRKADILLIVLDGRSVDEGAAFELGIAFGRGTPCYGLQTDPRRLIPSGNNPMIEGALLQVFSSESEISSWASSFLPETPAIAPK
jgi:nucleoside 2-deoxyribosyltransferase